MSYTAMFVVTRAFRFVATTTLASVIIAALTLIPANSSHSSSPEPSDDSSDGYAQVGDGAYLTSRSGLFDVPTDQGVTLEAWVYFDRAPRAGEQFMLLSEWGDYSVELWGGERYTKPWDVGFGDATTLVIGSTSARGGGSRGRQEIPLNRWVHVAMQYRNYKPESSDAVTDFAAVVPSQAWRLSRRKGPALHFVRQTWFDGKPGGKSAIFGGSFMADGSPAPPDPHHITPRTGFYLRVGADSASLSQRALPLDWFSQGFIGRISELRLSKTIRYAFDTPDDATPVIARRFQPDEHAIALWHFDEGADARVYMDEMNAARLSVMP